MPGTYNIIPPPIRTSYYSSSYYYHSFSDQRGHRRRHRTGTTKQHTPRFSFLFVRSHISTNLLSSRISPFPPSSRQQIITANIMKSLRRSLNNEKNSSSPQPSPPLPITYSGNPHALGRPAEKVAPPQKVIKALTSHQSTNPQELSYNKGDFWYVTGERDVWFEALSKS